MTNREILNAVLSATEAAPHADYDSIATDIREQHGQLTHEEWDTVLAIWEKLTH